MSALAKLTTTTSKAVSEMARTTASAIYNLPLGQNTNWSTSFVWGQNDDTHEGKTESLLLETDYQRGRDTVYARWERVEKSGHELVLKNDDLNEIFPANTATIANSAQRSGAVTRISALPSADGTPARLLAQSPPGFSLLNWHALKMIRAALASRGPYFGARN